MTLDFKTWTVAAFHNLPRVNLWLRTPDEPVSRADYNRALFEARMSSMSDVELKMPWETGIMKQLFDSDDDSVFPKVVPAVPPDYLMPVATSGAEPSEPLGMSGRPTADILVHAEVSMPLYSFAIKVVPDRDMFSEEAAVWKRPFISGCRCLTFLDFLACWVMRCFLNR